MTEPDRRDRFVPDIRWLLGGVLGGLVVAALGLLRQVDRQLPDGAVVRVNDHVISSDSYARALGRFRSDSKEELSDSDDAWVLQRLIEEELLVQRGLALGIARSENDVRASIVRSLIASITAEADAADPSAAELRKFFDDNSDKFTFSPTVMVEAWVSDDEQIARSYANGESGKRSVSASLPSVPGLPAGPLPPHKLRDYLGPTITDAVMRLPVSSTAAYPSAGRWYVVHVLQKTPQRIADFDKVRAEVLAAYRRSLADELLRDYLERLKQVANIDYGSVQR
jgi:parvulin-like peptidyl-prolyl isomerase